MNLVLRPTDNAFVNALANTGALALGAVWFALACVLFLAVVAGVVTALVFVVSLFFG